VSEKLGRKDFGGAHPGWLALPLVVFALITLTVGLVAGGKVREPYATPFFHLFFRDVLQMKAWLVTAAVVLACGQLLTAARIYEVLRFPPKGRFYHGVHRWSGRAAIVLTLPVAYHCIFLLGFGANSPRVLIRCRRQGAHGAIWQVCNMGAPRRRRPPVLDPPGAVADFRTRVFYRGSSAPRSVRRRPSATGRSYRATHGTCRRQPASPRPGRPRPPVPCPWGGCRCRCRAPEC